ncbi:oxygen-insensitive NADPH nitroreductase [Ornithinibacillus californiensis]|uniref:oxygen-insensitive NADPH nitroreductase n=1 Tax=Ornithinibacillus californiensis TaxID=161536 RepID=UPI00064D8FEC|nr:oxygen-insensitive NADPH nitroreductase [Ornithinibacillus californiensis]
MNTVIDTILSHRSVRKFEDKKLSQEQIETIVRSAQAASTSSYIQAYSIIGVTDQTKKEQLAEVAANQEYVAKNGHLFVFCADLHRHEVIGEMENADVLSSIESTEKFMVATIDASLAAQNASIAAESMGLGICYIGGLRNDLVKVSEILGTPDRVIPLFGLVVGHPAKINDLKPRLPLEHVYHENQYNTDEVSYKEQLESYNQTVQEYYQDRTKGTRTDTWTGQLAKMLGNKARMYMKDFVNGKGMNRR